MRYEKDMTGVLFINDRRSRDGQPELKGRCLINGRTLWISAWKKTPKKGGADFWSLAFDEPERDRPRSSQERDDDKIPF